MTLTVDQLEPGHLYSQHTDNKREYANHNVYQTVYRVWNDANPGTADQLRIGEAFMYLGLALGHETVDESSRVIRVLTPRAVGDMHVWKGLSFNELN